jgi:ParB family chromosome partitioning protein
MKSQALGRGLDALFGEIEEAYSNEGTQKDEILDVLIKEIKINPYQPRKYFDETSLQELSESIKNDGLLQPVILTQSVDGYTLIAGERRLRASKLAKLKTIKSIVISAKEQQLREFALIENIQRDELNSIELAFAYSELLKLHNLTHEELSLKIHKSRTHITNTLRLLQLSLKTQKALVEKKISAGHAKVLVGLSEKDQQLVVNSIIGQKLSVREVEALIKTMKSTVKLPVVKNNIIPKYDFSYIQDKFTYLGLKSKSSKNKLTIEFENEEQIATFLEQISK